MILVMDGFRLFFFEIGWFQTFFFEIGWFQTFFFLKSDGFTTLAKKVHGEAQESKNRISSHSSMWCQHGDW
jgi:hypothetical protein